ncbi:MATE family efflux transporter [Vagococcus sp.]|uniref:MATE family efflux transporter n=1 Tax=Vagococcus sp. TaxID=1933889 RepID=UPI002FCAA5A0
MWNQHQKVVKQLNSFSMPLIINQLTNNLLALFLSRFTGHISSNAITIVSIIDTIMFTLIGILGSGTLSFNIYSSRVKNSNPSLFNDFFRSIIELNLFISLTFLPIILISMPFILAHWFHFNHSLTVLGLKYTYIVIFKLLFSMLIFAFSNQLKLYNKTALILKIGVVSAVLQLAIAYLLIFHVFKGEDKIMGIALSTTLATGFTLLAHLFVIRKELHHLLNVKSTQKKFLFLKSLPLFIQEIIEGSVFSLLITSFLSGFGILIYSSYTLCRYITDLCLTPMYMYCNGLIILIGEKINHKRELGFLPLIAGSLILIIYFSFTSLFQISSPNVFYFFTKDTSLIATAKPIFLLIIITEASRPIYEIGKYSLQGIGFEQSVLKISLLNTILFCLLLLILSGLSLLTFQIIIILVAINNCVLGIYFYYLYRLAI